VQKKEYRLIKCSVPGGLGIQDLEANNNTLFGKWLYKLLSEEGGMTKSPKKKIYGLKGYLSTLLETMGCKLLGRSDGKKRIFHYGSFLIKNG
jgi:hypothetical protein